jgi:hypothetical protein
MHDNRRSEIKTWVRTSRKAQQLPPTIDDAAAIKSLVALLRDYSGDVDALDLQPSHVTFREVGR